MSIYKKIILIAGIILSIAIGINTIVSTTFFSKEYSKVLELRAIVIGQTLKSQLDRLFSLGIPLQELIGFEEQCKEVVNKYKDVKNAMVVDLGGRILFHNAPAQQNKILTNANILKFLNDKKDAPLVIRDYQENYYDIVIPIYNLDNRRVGAFVIEFSLAPIVQKTRALISYSFFVTLISFVIAISLLFWGVNLWINRPLTKLLLAIQETGKKGVDFKGRVEIDSKDELGRLAQSFNKMTEDLQKITVSRDELAKEIAERKKAEEELRQLLSLYDATLEATADGILVVDLNGHVVTNNQKFLQLWRIPDDLAATKDDDKLLAYVLDQLIDPEGFLAEVRRLYSFPKEQSFDLLRFKDGRVFERFSQPQRIGDKIVGRVWSFRHITERKRPEEELKAAYEELKITQAQLIQSEKMASIGQLAAGVAHEINNPMAFIISNISTLGKYLQSLSASLKRYADVERHLADLSNPEAGDLLREIQSVKKDLDLDYILGDLPKLIAESADGAQRVKKIVSDLRTFSHADEAELKYTNLNEIMESTLNIIWNELKYKTDVIKEYADLPQLICYPQQLSQVFMNLLINAVQAIKERGKITIKTYLRDNNIFVEISDTGCGIPEDILPKIFDPFFTTKPLGKGTGLGLSLVYNIIQKHKGEITVKSKVGEGSTFTIRLPSVGLENAG